MTPGSDRCFICNGPLPDGRIVWCFACMPRQDDEVGTPMSPGMQKAARALARRALDEPGPTPKKTIDAERREKRRLRDAATRQRRLDERFGGLVDALIAAPALVPAPTESPPPDDPISVALLARDVVTQTLEEQDERRGPRKTLRERMKERQRA